MKRVKLTTLMLLAVLVLLLGFARVAISQEPELILGLAIPDTARVADYDDGIYVVGTSGGNLYVINEAGEYTVTQLRAGRINDVRIENSFIAVAAGNTVIELELNGLTPQELWRTTSTDWYQVVSTDLSEDGDYVTYLAQRMDTYYVNAGEIGVLDGGVSGSGSLISKLYTSGYRPTNAWLDATGDMEYIAASHPTYPPYYRVGVGLYRFDGSALTLQWWKFLIDRYDVTEVRVSENKDYVAAATSSGTYMKLLRLSDGAILWSHNTPSKEQYACDGDDNLNYILGATQAWSAPYPWFLLRNLAESGCDIVAQGEMNGAINDLDSTPDGSYFGFGSDAGECILLDANGETIFSWTIGKLIDSIEIGESTLLVGGAQFINLYGLFIEVVIDIKRCSYPNAINPNSKGVIPVAILSTDTAVGEPVTFYVTMIDPETVRFGPSEAAPVHWAFEDVDNDGDLDMVLHFKTQETGIQLGDTEACLTGKTVDGKNIKGCDSIVTVPPE